MKKFIKKINVTLFLIVVFGKISVAQEAQYHPVPEMKSLLVRVINKIGIMKKYKEMKIKLFLIVILFGIIGPSKGQDGKKYYPSIGYEKFVGTYTFQDEHKDYVLKLESKEKVYFEPVGVYVDVLEGSIGYSEHGMSSKLEDSPQICFGFVDKNNPNIMNATYRDNKKNQSGTITIEFNPQDSSIVFTLKKIPGGVMFNDDEGLKRSRRPFAIPEELKLKRKKD